MNRNDVMIKFFVKKYKGGKLISDKLDHVIGKETRKQPSRMDTDSHRHNTTKKRRHYKKKGTGGYDR